MLWKCKPYYNQKIMKQKLTTLLFTLLVLSLGLQVRAQDKGIAFLPEGTLFKDAVAKAQQTGKMIFLDCYTSWCGPCKMMANTVFPQEKVGAYMNPRFVSIKIDMEKGEGVELTKKLQISAFPTFIFFNSNGEEIGRFLGGCDADKFIANVEKNSTDNGSADMDKRFAAGERDPQFLMQYLQTLGSAYKREQCNEVAEILLDGKAETFAADKTLADVFMKHISNPFCPAFVYTAKHPEALIAQVGETPVRMKLYSVWNTYPRTLVSTDANGNTTLDQANFDKWLALMEECGVENREELRLTTLLDYTEKKADWTAYVNYLTEYVKATAPNDLFLCKRCTPVAENCKDEALRKQVAAILQQRVDDLKSGKRQPQTQIGNMKMSGNMDKVMEMLIQGLETGEMSKMR